MSLREVDLSALVIDALVMVRAAEEAPWQPGTITQAFDGQTAAVHNLRFRRDGRLVIGQKKATRACCCVPRAQWEREVAEDTALAAVFSLIELVDEEPHAVTARTRQLSAQELAEVYQLAARLHELLSGGES